MSEDVGVVSLLVWWIVFAKGQLNHVITLLDWYGVIKVILRCSGYGPIGLRKVGGLRVGVRTRLRLVVQRNVRGF